MYTLTLKGAKSMPEKNCKLTLRIEKESGELLESVVNGTDAIKYIFEEAGLLDDKTLEFLEN